MARHRSLDASVPQFSGKPTEEPDRRAAMLQTLLVGVPVFGSIWWLPENLWRKKFRQSHQYYKSQGRNFHPGMSVLGFPGCGGHRKFPFLFGTSSRSTKAFMLEYMPPSFEDRNRGKVAHTSYFGVFDPVNLTESEWFDTPDVGGRTKRDWIKTLSDEERERLKQYMTERVKLLD